MRSHIEDDASTPPHDALTRRYDDALAEHGDTAAGALWPNEADRRTRFGVMLDVIDAVPAERVTLCDLGCGTGELFGYLRERGFANVDYLGVDQSHAALDFARRKFPDATFLERDIGSPAFDASAFACDYLVANGLFTYKYTLSHADMAAFFERAIRALWPHVRRGIAFNVMSKVVDWERDDLFHLPMDDAARLLHELAGRNVRFRADYGLYEYTAYARKPRPETPRAGGREPASATARRIPVLRPQLPAADAVLLYLRRIDAARTYSNHGPLNAEFEGRLAAALDVSPVAVTTAANGTAAIAGAILGTAGRASAARPLAFLPAFTFVGTPVAVEQCGYRPYLIDCDAESWQMTPELVLASPALDRCGIVVVVAPFGRPVPQAPWRAFTERTGIPVVIDGAASFDLVAGAPHDALGAIPTAFSFHATKAFGIGEGGAVVTTDAERSARITQALNFGFRESRNSATPSINGKLSEYHAAVGLAAFDEWPEKRARHRAVAAAYRDAVAASGGRGRFHTSPEISCGYVLYGATSDDGAAAVVRALDAAAIDSRLWYGRGIRGNDWYAQDDGDDLSVTNRVAPRLIGLPVAPDLDTESVRRIVATIVASDRDV